MPNFNGQGVYKRGLLSDFANFLRDPQSQQEMGQGLMNAANRGLIAQTLGAPVDIATQATNLLRAGYGYAGNKLGLLSASQMPDLLRPEDQVGSSEWIGKKLADNGYITQDRNPVAETLAGLLAPAVIKGATKLGSLAYTAEQAARANAAAPSKFNALTQNQGGAVVWHGSPHKFDKFDASKIGTGEGAQAYGHGLYVAESPDVAKMYQDKLTDPAFKYAGMNDAKRRLNEKIAARVEATDPARAAALRAEVASLGDPGGALYKIDLPDEHIAKMLDWDKPLSEQPAILDAANRIYQELPELYPSVGNVLATPGVFDGQHLYQALVNHGPPSAASATLRSLGIPGIKYLDGGSRAAGRGTSNFVVFPGAENALNILERNGSMVGE